MKLITEHNEDVEYITEMNSDGSRSVFIEGIFMQADKENRNKRIYPKKILSNAVERYIKEQVQRNRAVGELNHPDGPTINLDKVSHRITDMKWDGNNVIGKAHVLNTPMGKIVSGLIEGGVKLGVSSRGMGNVENKGGKTYVKDDFTLSTVDIVQDPSAHEAFVDGIMEGVEWIWDNGIIKPQKIEQYETEIKNASSKNLAEAQTKAFQDFLSQLI